METKTTVKPFNECGISNALVATDDLLFENSACDVELVSSDFSGNELLGFDDKN